MLALDQIMVTRLARERRRDFAWRLLRVLEAEYPALFAPMPPFVRAAMVCNGLDRAESFGFTLESTLGEFVALQCASAPDFFQHPQLQALLRSSAVDEGGRLATLHAQVDAETWRQMRAGADLRAWFEPVKPEQGAARIAARVCSEFPTLAQQVPAAELLAFFHAAAPRAQRHGIRVEAGIVVFAAALAWYGSKLDSPDRPAWACKAFYAQPPLPSEHLVALLRQALAMDSGRLV